MDQKIITFTLIIVLIYALLVGIFLYNITNEMVDTEPNTYQQHQYNKISLPPKSIDKIEAPIESVGNTGIVINPKYKEFLKEAYLLARIINAEAGTQPYRGKIAVGNVIMNRVESTGFPDNIKGVIFQKGQFDPVRDGSINKKPNTKSIQAAKEVLNGKRIFNEDVLFFYNPDISTSDWIFTRDVVTKIGDHAFAI